MREVVPAPGCLLGYYEVVFGVSNYSSSGRITRIAADLSRTSFLNHHFSRNFSRLHLTTMKDHSVSYSGKPKLPTLLTEHVNLAFLNRLPSRSPAGRRRAKSKSKSTHPGVDDITSLRTSFSFWDGIRDLQKHQWRLLDIQYPFLIGLVLFSLWIAPPAPALKMFSLMAAVWVLLMPATRQFFLPSSTIWIWLLYFFCSR